MKLELKFVSEESIPKSLRKAHQYRLLNEPMHAESICRDVLRTDPDNQQALDILILALTQQFDQGGLRRFDEAMSLRDRLTDAYRRTYLDGLIRERRAMAIFRTGEPGAGGVAYEGLMRAMEAYEQAIAISPNSDDDAVLRWNACIRMLRHHTSLVPGSGAP